MNHVRLSQVYKDVPVYGGELIAHVKQDGALRSLTGRFVKDISLNPHPSVSSDTAVAKALELFQGAALVEPPTLWVFSPELLENKEDGARHLAWEVKLENLMARRAESLFIDAHSLELLYQVNLVKSATYRDIPECTPGNICREVWDYIPYEWTYLLDYYDARYDYTFGRSEFQPARGVNPVSGARPDVVFDRMLQVHNYYKDVFGRNGANGEGGLGDGIRLPKYLTDFLIDEGTCGAGGGYYGGIISICSGGGSLIDVTGHEYTHGFYNASPLIYSGESGALEEARATVAEEGFQWYVTGAADWKYIGGYPEHVGISYVDPHTGSTLAPAPDHFHDAVFQCGGGDGGGVHKNSAVPGKASYLIATGGTFNGCTINALGMEKVLKIWYHAFLQYFISSTNFNSAYSALIQSCEDLYGYPDCHEVAKALRAVEMDQPGACSGVAEQTPRCTKTDAPTIGAATAGDAQATVAFTPPANLDSWMKWYTVTSNPGNIRVSDVTSPITVTGLTAGTSYTFTVTATSVVGTSAASAVSTRVGPPAAPTVGTAAATSATTATVAFTAPADTGGGISSYTATSNTGISASGTTSPITVTGLAAGGTYTFTVTATNGMGTGPASAASNSITLSSPELPGKPEIGTATGGNQKATIRFLPPSSTGGSPITGYRVTSSPEGKTATGTASPITVTGLTNGVIYTFTVQAANSTGYGAASNPSNPVTPAPTVPGAPRIGVALPGNLQATVFFTAPASDGGSKILSYTVTSSPGNIKATATASPIVVKGLTTGTTYTFTVAATNAVGTGPASGASNSIRIAGNCSDTDGGMYPLVAGTVKYRGGVTLADRCLGGGYLAEYYCLQTTDVPAVKITRCTNGCTASACRDGFSYMKSGKAKALGKKAEKTLRQTLLKAAM